MSRGIRLAAHVEVGEPERRCQTTKEPHERSWWQTSGSWQGPDGSPDRRRYNQQRPDGMVNQSPTH